METKKLKVKNLPDYAGLYDYIIYRSVNGEAWFYGAENDVTKAAKVAEEIHGYVVEARKVETL